MAFTLDAKTEQRVLQKIEAGPFTEPAQVINRALDLLDSDETWSDEEKAQLEQQLTIGTDQIKRGEGIPSGKVREALKQLRNEQASERL